MSILAFCQTKPVFWSITIPSEGSIIFLSTLTVSTVSVVAPSSLYHQLHRCCSTIIFVVISCMVCGRQPINLGGHQVASAGGGTIILAGHSRLAPGLVGRHHSSLVGPSGGHGLSVSHPSSSWSSSWHCLLGAPIQSFWVGPIQVGPFRLLVGLSATQFACFLVGAIHRVWPLGVPGSGQPPDSIPVWLIHPVSPRARVGHGATPRSTPLSSVGVQFQQVWAFSRSSGCGLGGPRVPHPPLDIWAPFQVLGRFGAPRAPEPLHFPAPSQVSCLHPFVGSALSLPPFGWGSLPIPSWATFQFLAFPQALSILARSSLKLQHPQTTLSWANNPTFNLTLFLQGDNISSRFTSRQKNPSRAHIPVGLSPR